MLGPKRGSRDDYPRDSRAPPDDRYRTAAPRRTDSYNDRQVSGGSGRRDGYTRDDRRAGDGGARYDDRERDRDRERERGYMSSGSGGGRAVARPGEGRERDALWSMFRAVDRDSMLVPERFGSCVLMPSGRFGNAE